MRQLAPLFGISSATVCRVIQRLGPLLALEPAPRPVAGADRLWIVDGTLIPVRDRTVGASSRNYRFSANVQVIIDADSRLVVASARPAPGNKADAHLWRESDLSAVRPGQGSWRMAPTRGPASSSRPDRGRGGRPLLRGREEDNAEHRRVRAHVEHTFARMKNWKILRDCRQRGDGLHHAVQADQAGLQQPCGRARPSQPASSPRMADTEPGAARRDAVHAPLFNSRRCFWRPCRYRAGGRCRRRWCSRR
ncbi:transposase family protein [Streptomyces sp. NPDC003032]